MPWFAAVDVGSSATRLTLVELSSTGREVARVYQRYPLRLGADVFATGALGVQSEDALVQAFVDIAARLAEHGVAGYRAVGTSALRDASNGGALCKRVNAECGVDLEIISGREESRLARQALVEALGAPAPETLILDLGGGSLELEHARGRAGRSLPFGTVRLTDRFPILRGPLSVPELHEIQRQLHRELVRRLPRRRHVDLAVASGGNLDVLARVLPRRGGVWPAIELERMQDFVEGVARLTVEERRELLGVRADRADLLLTAALVVGALGDLYKLRTVVVPGTGLREAMLRELVSAPRLDAQSRVLLRKFRGDVERGARRAALARELFVALTPLHRLWEPARAVLEVAAFLADVGQTLDPEDFRQHSAYIVRGAVQLALDARARSVAAYALALCAGDPLPEFTATLLAEDLPIARMLAAILGLADVLALEPTAPHVRIDLMSSPVVLDLGLTRPLDPRRAAGLERALGQRLRIL